MNTVKFWHTLAGALAIRLAVCTAGCSTPGDAAPEANTASGRAGGGGGGRRGGGGGGGPVPVVTTHAVTKAVPLTIPAVGTVEALSTVQIRAQVTGQLQAIGFVEGQEVQKGQLLFTVDPRPFQAALEQARAALARDTATSTNLQSQAARYSDLFKRGLISQEQYDAQSAAAKASSATLDLDRAAISTAEFNLQNSRITAPVSGRTGALGVHIGDIIRANDINPLVVINQLSPIYVTFSVPGRYLADIRRYQSQHPLAVEVRTQNAAMPGTQSPVPSATPDVSRDQLAPPIAEGRTAFIDNTVDPTTGTLKMKAVFPNSDRALWPGLFVQVSLNLTTDTDALVVPAAAVQTSQTGQFVYVVTPDRIAELRPITVARQQGSDVVVASGLQAGEEVVTDGQLRLVPGARVGAPGVPGGAAGGGRNGRNGRGRSGQGTGAGS